MTALYESEIQLIALEHLRDDDSNTILVGVNIIFWANANRRERELDKNCEEVSI